MILYNLFILFASLFKTPQSQVIKDQYTEKTALYIGLIGGPWVALILGWFVHAVILR